MASQQAAHLPRPKRVAIIGAGVVGLSCGLHLQHLGYDVEIFDPREPGTGASYGNAGIIAVSEVLPLGRLATLRLLPSMLLDSTGPLVIRWRYLPHIAPWLLRLVASCRPAEVERIAAALAALLSQAVAAWRELLHGSPAQARLVSSGWLRAYDSERSLKRALPDIERQRRLGVKLQVLDARALREFEPALAPVFAGATFCPDVCHLDSPFRTMQALATMLAAGGGVFRKCAVQRLDMEQGRPAIVDGDGNRVIYDRVVIAAGAWSRQLVRSLGTDVRLDTERGYHLMLPTPPRTLKHPVSIANPGYSLVQMEDGLRLTSGVEFAGLDAPADFRRVRRMVTHAARSVPGLEPNSMSEWLGFRPSMPHSLPVIGPVPNHPNVLLAFGHGHLGVTLGPLTGRLIAALAEGRPTSIDITPFLPGLSGDNPRRRVGTRTDSYNREEIC
ncbi:MAG TPA: FAD-binding oxidoreductase [Alphaproteobacteria bacterium]|nr:FAD-binding oxidoreductase [Alphaproteobacteria bacterium]